MIFTDSLLDTSWTLQFMPGVRRNFKRLDELISTKSARSAAKDDFKLLGDKLYNHLSYRDDNEPRDELNDQSASQGRLWKCSVSPIIFTAAHSNDEEHCGLLIEAHHQLAAYRVAILRMRERRDDVQDSALILFKGNPKFVSNVRDWLDTTFELPPTENLHLSPSTVLEVFSGVLDVVSSGWPSDASRTDAIRLALVRQVIGNVRITITITVIGTDLATKLKHIDLDIPSDTFSEIISEDTALGVNAKGTGSATLEKLSKAIHRNTGLNLPFTTDSTSSDEWKEQPWKVSKLACAAFALSADGKLKLSGKPIEQAELMGYEQSLVRDAMSRILEILFQGIESRLQSSSNG